MFQFLMRKKSFSATVGGALAMALVVLSGATVAQAQQDLNGRELLSVTRVAHGGAEYAGLQFITSKSTGFVNVAPVVGAGLGTGGAMSTVEVKLNLTDYQDKDSRRRLDVTPTGGMPLGQTYLVYTGSTGGGMYMGNEFRVSEAAASRHWGLMGFGTLNRAVDGQIPTDRLKDDGNSYVVEVKFNKDDSIRYWIDKSSFLISKVRTYYNGKMLVEEERSDYRRANCMMLPFRVVTRLGGQRLADLTIDSYDLKTEVPGARFTMSKSE
jgi:hypothetical protein